MPRTRAPLLRPLGQGHRVSDGAAACAGCDPRVPRESLHDRAAERRETREPRETRRNLGPRRGEAYPPDTLGADHGGVQVLGRRTRAERPAEKYSRQGARLHSIAVAEVDTLPRASG